MWKRSNKRHTLRGRTLVYGLPRNYVSHRSSVAQWSRDTPYTHKSHCAPYNVALSMLCPAGRFSADRADPLTDNIHLFADMVCVITAPTAVKVPVLSRIRIRVIFASPREASPSGRKSRSARHRFAVFSAFNRAPLSPTNNVRYKRVQVAPLRRLTIRRKSTDNG